MTTWTKETINLAIAGDSLTIDDIVINGNTIGHTDDTNLLTIYDGALRVQGTFRSDGDITGNVVGNITGNVLTAAQTNITSLGTLSSLTIDDIVINGENIGHSSDTDLLYLQNGLLYINGSIACTGGIQLSGDLTIQGGNITNAITCDSTVTTTGLLTATAGVKLGNNIIYASDGGTSITLDTSDNVRIGGSLRVDGNIIKASDGGSTITMDTDDNVTIAGNLKVEGNLISPNTNSSLSLAADGYVTTVIDSDDDNTDREFRVFHNEVDAANRLFRVREDSSIAFGIATHSGVGFLAIPNGGTYPSSVANQIFIGAKDSTGLATDGSTLAIRVEQAVDSTALDAVGTLTKRIPIFVNNVEYWLYLDPV